MSIPQSLPSFAQAFSSSSLSDAAPISNALPPIQARPAHSPPASTKKRLREDPPRTDRTSVDAHNADTARQSPIAVRIKEEDREDAQPPPQPGEASRDSSATPGIQPLSKKRRVTVTGVPRSSAEQGTPVPASPVVSTFNLPDEAVPRPVLVKQQQKTLVDQRRESISAVISSTAQSPMVSGSILSRSPPSDSLTTSKLTRIGRVSPGAMSLVNRTPGNAVASGSQVTARPLTPPAIIVQQPPPLASAQNLADSIPIPIPKPQQSAAAHSLPPPPISFARRRAAQSGGRKKKPADILISPRGTGPADPLAPVIQSAPPVADPGRFPMAIPRLPLALNNAQTPRRIAGNVPPTPTRFSLQGNIAPLISSTARTMQSPPSLSVPISNTLVPPTPHALQHPGYAGDKSAFLAPFEVFYDALHGSKQLKNWLSDQLQKSNALMVSLKQQQDKMDEIVEDLVEKRTRIMREEIAMLRQRMESLEEALLAVRAESSTRGQDRPGYGYSQGPKSHQNGVPPGADPSPSRFPAAEQRRPDSIIRVTSPGREHEHQSSSSPPVEVTRRLSVSAASARSEPSQVLHTTFTLGGHSRRASGPLGSTKSILPARSPLPERSSTARPTDTRTASRLFYPGTNGNGSPLLVQGQATPREGHKQVS